MWATEPDRLVAVPRVNRVEMDLLVGVERARDTLMENTLHFAQGFPANNALLWGARGMGKSSLVKAAHATAKSETGGLHLVEIQREDIPTIGRLMDMVRDVEQRFIVFAMT